MISMLAAVASLTIGQADLLTITASIPDSELAVGDGFEVSVEVTPGAGWTTDDAGLPGSVIQIGTPDAAPLVGKELTSLRELSRNGFLMAPHERMASGAVSTIEFTLASAPDADDRIAVNVLSYLKHEDGRFTFARRRVELPIEAGASGSSSSPATSSDWGGEGAGLQIGDEAAVATLPDKDGEMIALGERFAESDVILTTYRAFW